jgi:hypothetical protein
MKLDKFAWAIEGLVPVIIPALLFFVMGFNTLSFYVAFSGSIAFTQLFSSIVKASDLYPNLTCLKRVDNILRITIMVIVASIFIFKGNLYLLFWIILNIIFISWIGRLFFLGRFRYTLCSLYSRSLNFIFIFSHTHLVPSDLNLQFINPFSTTSSLTHSIIS